MIFRNRKSITSPQFMIIPMIDIIFFLLVFFMMSSLQTISQRNLPIQIPQANNTEVSAQVPVVLTITVDGKLQMEGKQVSLEVARQVLGAKIQTNSQLPVVLQADKQAAHGQVVEILDMLKTIGVKKMGIAAEKKEG